MSEKKKYEIFCEEWNEEGTACPCYGLVCEDLTIHYVSTDKDFVEKIASVLNDLDVDPSRAQTVVEDLLP